MIVCESIKSIKIKDLQTKAFFSNKEVQPNGSRTIQLRLCSKIRSITITQFFNYALLTIKFFEIKLGFAMHASGLEPSHALKSY